MHSAIAVVDHREGEIDFKRPAVRRYFQRLLAFTSRKDVCTISRWHVRRIRKMVYALSWGSPPPHRQVEEEGLAMIFGRHITAFATHPHCLFFSLDACRFRLSASLADRTGYEEFPEDISCVI